VQVQLEAKGGLKAWVQGRAGLEGMRVLDEGRRRAPRRSGSKPRQRDAWLCVSLWGEGVEHGRHNGGSRFGLSGTAATDSDIAGAFRQTGCRLGRQQPGFGLGFVFLGCICDGDEAKAGPCNRVQRACAC
jgi:hypothetical protein